MATSRINSQARLPRLLQGDQSAGPTYFVDVGCSGGVDGHWLQFEENLRGVGFDPLITEIERLRAQNTIPGLKYEDAFVGFSEYGNLFPKSFKENNIENKTNQWFERTSARAYTRTKAMSYEQAVFNRGSELVYSDRWIDLDQYCKSVGMPGLDFLKVDTDGSDIIVLLGAREQLTRNVLGVEVEAQFTGEHHPYANTLFNIDRLMREAGLTLVDLETYRYTRAALPGRFYYDIAAQTTQGATQWGEAIYARDLADPDYEKKYPLFKVTPEAVLKLACFYEIYGLPDCAAEVLVARRAILEPKWNVTALLDGLVWPDLGAGMTYEEYLNAFNDDPDRLMPSRL
jgi:FkbM family methyltransferase